MPKKDPRVDAYIAKSADFAKPILKQLRAMVHAACPQVTEDIKWGVPHFMYHGMLCGMAAFKQHCAFGFWHKGMREALKRSARPRKPPANSAASAASTTCRRRPCSRGW